MEPNGWESLERDGQRAFEVLPRQVGARWQVEARFGGGATPKRESQSAKTRVKARKIGQEIAKTQA